MRRPEPAAATAAIGRREFLPWDVEILLCQNWIATTKQFTKNSINSCSIILAYELKMVTGGEHELPAGAS